MLCIRIVNVNIVPIVSIVFPDSDIMFCIVLWLAIIPVFIRHWRRVRVYPVPRDVHAVDYKEFREGGRGT